MNARNIFFAFAFAFSLSSCTPAPSVDGSGDNNNDNGVSGALTGELFYFFGRPAPQWTLSEEDGIQIAARLTGLTPIARNLDFPRFGPVAFHVLNTVNAAGIPEEVVVQDGTLMTRVGETFSYYSDDKDLEGLLRASAVADGVYAELGIIDAASKSAIEVSHE